MFLGGNWVCFNRLSLPVSVCPNSFIKKTRELPLWMGLHFFFLIAAKPNSFLFPGWNVFSDHGLRRFRLKLFSFIHSTNIYRSSDKCYALVGAKCTL